MVILQALLPGVQVLAQNVKDTEEKKKKTTGNSSG